MDKENENLSHSDNQASDMYRSDSGDASSASKNSQKTKKSFFTLFSSIASFFNRVITKWLPVVVGIATIGATLLTWGTLKEMQKEHDYSYHPEIVVSPCVFKGGPVGSDDVQMDKNYLFINYEESDPWRWYSGSTVNTEYSMKKEIGAPDSPWDNTNLLYLEIPYLTLKNIGQGTAREVQVTFSTEWVENAVNYLNAYPFGYRTFYFETMAGYPGTMERVNIEGLVPLSGFLISYVDYSSPPDNEQTSPIPCVFLSSYDIDEQKTRYISYISNDEDTVIVPLPQSWVEMLAVHFVHHIQFWQLVTNPAYKSESSVSRRSLPDLLITIQYKDMQGKQYTQEFSIPCTLSFMRSELSTSSQHNEKSLYYLSASFYEDNIR